MIKTYKSCELMPLWQYNYGGILDKRSAGSSEVVEEADMAGEPQVDIASSWNIADQLPTETQVVPS